LPGGGTTTLGGGTAISGGGTPDRWWSAVSAEFNHSRKHCTVYVYLCSNVYTCVVAEKFRLLKT